MQIFVDVDYLIIEIIVNGLVPTHRSFSFSKWQMASSLMTCGSALPFKFNKNIVRQ